jgi:hypothetical protein
MAARVPFDPFGAMLEGYRQADADNKQDLSFNAALEGAWLGNDAKHVQNLFNYDTYGGAKQMFMNQAEQSARNNAIQNAMHPGNFAAASMGSADKGLGWSTYQALMAQIEANKRNAAKTALDVSNINLGFAGPIAQQTGTNTAFGLGTVIPSYNEQLERDRQLWEATLAQMGGFNPTPTGVDLGVPAAPPQDAAGLGAGGYAGYSPELPWGVAPTWLGPMPNGWGLLSGTPVAPSPTGITQAPAPKTPVTTQTRNPAPIIPPYLSGINPPAGSMPYAPLANPLLFR